MLEIEKLDNELYYAMYGLEKDKDASTLWEKIKSNPEILREAVKIKRNKWNNGDEVNGLAICNAMLIDYENVDACAYNELIKNIYSNTDIARTVIKGASNGGYSFLLMSLWNNNIKLTKKQKTFAINEAMNKIGTIRYENKLNDYDLLDKYFKNIFTFLSNTQVHGYGDFDIRYWILKNPNWTLNEKQKLIMDFWASDDCYNETLEQWQWAIVNDSANYKGELLPQFDKDEMYNYSYDELLKFYGDKNTTDRIYSEIQFCKQMHNLRPQCEKESSIQKILIKNN